MGNDREVKSLVSTRDFFLRKDLSDLHENREVYDLDQEFHKTKGNRKIWISLTVLGMVLLLALTAFLITRIVTANTKNYELDLDTFKDVDLSEILDEVKKLERELQAVEKDLSRLISEKNLKIRDINDKAEQDIKLLSTMGYSAYQIRRSTANIEDERDQQISLINEEYDPLIEEKRQALAIIEERKNRYDSRQVEQAREQQKQMDNQQRLFDLERQSLQKEHEDEIQQLTTDYNRKITELKAYIDKFDTNLKDLYDPVYGEESINALLNAKIDSERRRENLPLFNPLYYSETQLPEERINALDLQLREIRTLINKIYDIPFENSTSEALIQIDYRILKLIDSLKTVMDDMSEEQIRALSQLQKERDSLYEMYTSYSYAMEKIARETGGQGFIIDSRNKKDMLVYIDPVLEVQDGTTALVFRLDEQLIGKVKLYKDNGFIRAELQEEHEDFTIQPFDKLVLNVGSGN